MGINLGYTERDKIIETISDRMKKLVPQELIQNWIYYRIKRAGRVVKCYDNVEVPLLPTVPSFGKWMGRGVVLPTGGASKMALATFNNRYLAVPITYDMFDEFEQNGNPAVIFKTAERQAMMGAWGMRRLLSNAVLNGVGGLQPDGLVGRILEKLAPASQVQVVGNVDKAAKPWWRNPYVELTVPFGTIPVGTQLPAGILALLQLLDACTNGTNFPTDLVVGKPTFRNIRRAMFEMTSRFAVVSEETDVNFGFKSINLDGAKIAWDPSMPADTVLCTHIGSKKDARRMGENTTQMDGDLEDAGGVASSLLDLEGGLFVLQNPNVNMRRLAQRTPMRTLQSAEWILTSFNLGVFRMSDHGLAGSNTGTQWDTWL